MSEARRGGVDRLTVISGGAQDPLVLAGIVDPTAGGGVAAPEGSTYHRYVSAVGELWLKYGAANTAWRLVSTGGGTLLNVADLTALGAVSTPGIDDGSVAYVRSLDAFYTLTKTGGPYTPDGITVVAGAGGGYWLGQVQGRWDDLQGSVDAGNRQDALTREVYRDTNLLMLFFRHDQDDSLHFVYQLPHKWRGDTDVHPHLHVVPMADPAADEDVYFEGQYTWAPIGFSPIPALAGWTSFNATLTISPGDIYEHMIAELGQFAPPASPTASTCLLLYLERAGTNVLDTYDTNKASGTPAANLAVLSTDLHYRAEKFGTITEYS